MRGTSLLALLLLAAASSAGAEDHVISQKGKRFQPEALRVRVGDRVLFQNDDEITHNVFSRTAGGAFNVGLQEPGSSSPVTFEKPGPVEVRCAIHPAMKMTIEVAK
jgi:plastocyanin